ncbi:MAG: GntR family transcriptional regulator [Rhodocyclaceae bacterium]|nr:GntR family transcriptional regulator [Rhodocyclaceae bacterium]
MVSTIKPLQRPLALGDQVYQTLRAHLRDGTIATGQPLQEVQLAERLGVSRTPVREALTRLASEGLLASDGRSFVVPSLTLSDVDDIYEVRFLIEPAALRRVAELTTDPGVRAPIDEALAAANAAYKAGDADAFREANIRFRNAWKDLVPNRRLVRAIEQYADHMLRIRALTLGDPKIRSIVIKGLRRIADALAAGDGDAAAAAMRDHLGEAKRAFIIATGLDQPETE